jgi:nitrite reductase/ring-hydroxylating ferredoxin subunit
MQEHKVDRRRFLTLVAQGSLVTAALAAASQVVRFLAYEPPNSNQTIVPLGQPDSFPRDSLVYVAGARVYVGHDGEGLFVVDAVCPHLGCLVELGEEGGFICPCHDSRFDAEGQVLNGPATQPLDHLHLWFNQEDGQLYVDRTEPVGPTVRLSP